MAKKPRQRPRNDTRSTKTTATVPAAEKADAHSGILGRVASSERWLKVQVERLRKWSFVEFLEVVSRFSILVAALTYLSSVDERREEKHRGLWQTLVLAQGRPGNGGRIAALEELGRDGVVLSGVNVSGAYLRRANLRGTMLWSAQFDSADLTQSVFCRADLAGASLRHAALSDANLADATLSDADLRGANLSGANLSGAILVNADLRGAILEGANVKDAIFHGADLRGAYLGETLASWLLVGDLSETNIYQLEFTKENDLLTGRMEGEMAPETFTAWAVDSMGAVLIAPGTKGDSLWKYNLAQEESSHEGELRPEVLYEYWSLAERAKWAQWPLGGVVYDLLSWYRDLFRTGDELNNPCTLPVV